MKREFSKEETQMSKNYFQRNLTLLSIRDFKLKSLGDIISTNSGL